MAIYDGFFDAALNEETNAYDRAYDAGTFTEYFEQFIGSGVCIYNNPDSMMVGFHGGNAVVAPGYLFIQGYWLKNDGPYEIPLPGAGVYAVAAHLNIGLRMVEIIAQAKASPEVYPDSLILAYVTVDAAGAGTVEDTRRTPGLCGVVDAMGALSDKVAYAVDYIDNEIAGKLQQAEADIAAQAVLLDAKIAQVAAEVDKLAPPPIGTVKFSASRDVGPEWLRCDGRFINEADYPELVAALGKLTPGSSEFTEIAEGRIPRDISNAVLSGGKLWVFSFSAKKLYGISLTSPHTVAEIPVIGGDLLYSPAQEPIYLSIIDGKYLFLTQRAGVTTVYVYKTYAFNSGAVDTIELSQLTWDPPARKPNDTERCAAHYVIRYQDKFYMAMGIRIYTTYTVPYDYYGEIMYIVWDAEDTVGEFPSKSYGNASPSTGYPIASTINYYSTTAKGLIRGLYGFSSKNNGELLFYSGYVSNNSPNPPSYRPTVRSFPRETYVINGTYDKGYTTRTTPADSFGIVSSDGKHALAYVHKYLSDKAVCIGYINEGNSGELTLNLPALPNLSQNFIDCAVYAAEVQVWLMFLGSGILFTRDLSDAAQYGFLDTSGVLGVISASGYLDYDAESKTVYIVGQDTTGAVRVGALKLRTLYDYANDGAWLPMIASDGVPAYIKAKEPAAVEEG